MLEHPLPQDVTGYQFHIIGNMTIKQFAEVGFGCFVGFIIYTTNLTDVIKWPLIFLAAGMGAAAAFLPIEERPLDHWILTFFKAIYRPTKFYWKREAKIPDPFLYSPNSDVTTVIEVDLTPVRRQRIKDYMASIRRPNNATDSFDQYMSQRVGQVLDAFAQVDNDLAPEQTPSKTATKPNLVVKVRQMRQLESHQPDTAPLGQAEPIPTTLDVNNQPSLPAPDFLTHRQVVAETAGETGISVPHQKMIEVEQSATALTEETAIISPQTQDAHFIDNYAPTQPTSVVTNQATFNQQLPFPSTPTQPNKLVGMVLDSANNLISNAIVEITDRAGTVIRAVKTNALGQFYITTPLANGEYVLKVEEANHSFTPISLSLTGAVVQPVEIRSTD